MKFVKALWFLRKKGVKVELSTFGNDRGIFYKVYSTSSRISPMWALPEVVCSLADRLDSIEEKETIYAP